MDQFPGLIFSILTILGLLVTGSHCTCDIPAATACINTITVPDTPTVEQCDTALEAVFMGSTCIAGQTSTCTTLEADSIHTDLQTLQDSITAVCADKKCADIGNKYVTYRQCLVDNDIINIIQDILIEWNKSGYQQTQTVEQCQRARTLNTCLSQSSKSCTPLREQFGLLYADHLALKQVQDICGLEIIFLENEGPIISDCIDDLTTTTAEVINNCAFDIDYTDNTVTIINYCRSMQVQIDCVVAYQARCPRVVTNFLKPRLDTYATANTKYCGNMTVNGVNIKPIPSSLCRFDNIFSCFFNVMRLFGPVYTSISDRSLRTFFTWNIQDNTDLCRELRKNNFTEYQVCAYHSRTECRIPSPTFGYYPISLGDVYDHELYSLLLPGPVPLNEFGAKFIGNRRNYICYDCDNYETMKESFDTDCAPPVRTLSQQINTTKANNDPAAALCSELTLALQCVSNTSMTCPLFYHQADDLLEEVSAAVGFCGITDLELLPADFRPTTIPTTIPPSKMPTTRGTLGYSTSTFAPATATTRNSSTQSSNTSSMMNTVTPTISEARKLPSLPSVILSTALLVLSCAIF